MAWTWEFMTTMFRGLGGGADNIVQKDGPFGKGIFPINPAAHVRVHTPQNLLIPTSDVDFVDGRLVVRPESKVGSAERTFFENYHAAFSWGAEGRASSLAFIEALDALPADIRAILSGKFGLRPLTEDISKEARAQRWFIGSRAIRVGGKEVMMPLVELLNHATNGKTYDLSEGVTVEGQFSGEVLARYSVIDPLGIFLAFGFASAEGACFSLPFRQEQKGISIDRSVNFDVKAGDVQIPSYAIEGDELKFSCLMIGNAKYPRLSRAIFQRAMSEAGKPKADEVFDLILHQNRTRFLELLAKLEECSNPLVPTLRKMAIYQLAAMSHCIGTRAV